MKTKCPFNLQIAYRGFVIAIVAVLIAFRADAQVTSVETLFEFNGINGSGPVGCPVIADNVVYGTTCFGNINSNSDPAYQGFGTGTIFRMNTDGTGFINLYNFSSAVEFGFNTDGEDPFEGLTLYNNVLYGTAQVGGAFNGGTIFKINTDGTGFTLLHTFSAEDAGCNADGIQPCGYAGLLVTNNVLYGTALGGGDFGSGTVFSMNLDGTGFNPLHSFTDDPGPASPDGAQPYNSLVLSGNTIFGITTKGGSSSGVGSGTIFRVNTDGTGYANIHNFSSLNGICNSDGAYPTYLILNNNVLYGLTLNGGANGNGTLFSINTDGTGFTTLFNFTSTVAGSFILSGNTFYGVDSRLFSINIDGTGFTYMTSNAPPYFLSMGLILVSNTIYGYGGTNDNPNFGGFVSASPVDPYAVSKPIILDINADWWDWSWTTVGFSWDETGWTTRSRPNAIAPNGAMYELQVDEDPNIDVLTPVTNDSLIGGPNEEEITFPGFGPDQDNQPTGQHDWWRMRYVNGQIYGPWSDSVEF